MICPVCTEEMTKTGPDTYECGRDEVLMSVRVTRLRTYVALNASEETVRTAEQSSKCPRRDLRIVALDVQPNGVKLGDLVVHKLALRKVVNLQRAGLTGAGRRLYFADSSTHVMWEVGRVYRSPESSPPTPARAGAGIRTRPR